MNEQIDQDVVLDKLLADFPQAPLPAGFVAGVMAQVEAQRESAHRVTPAQFVLPPFRLQFIDWVLPAFAAVFLGIVFVLIGQTDWLTALLTTGETTTSPSFVQTVLLQDSLHLGLIITAVIGELAVVAIICFQLWGESLDWVLGD